MPLTPLFLARLEANMRVITENQYIGALKNLWAPKVLKEIGSDASAEHLFFLISSGAMDYGVEGNVNFLSQATARLDMTPKFIDAPGLEILKSELEDSDGAGLQKARDWSAKIAVQAAMFAQRKVAALILSPLTAYDGVAFFGTTHPLAYGSPGVGTYANDLTSSASGVYPGAVPITGDAATASANLGKAVAYIRSLMSPDGVTPRGLEPKVLLCGPLLYRQALIATASRFISGSSNGPTDVEAIINDYNLEVVMAPELGADTNYYLVCEQVGTEVGPYVWLNREPVQVVYHGPQTSAELARRRVFQWTVGGRGIVAQARPDFIFRCKPT